MHTFNNKGVFFLINVWKKKKAVLELWFSDLNCHLENVFAHEFLGATPAAFGSADLGWDSGTCISPSAPCEGADGPEPCFEKFRPGEGLLPTPRWVVSTAQ